MSIVAVAVGHRASRPGAVNKASGVTEFAFNSDLGEAIHDLAPDHTALIYRMPGGYSTLPYRINKLNPSVAIELHLNANEGIPGTGTEVMYWPGSGHGLSLATELSALIAGTLDIKNRGAKEPVKYPSGKYRGGHFLGGVRAPALIVESFFLNNDDDLQRGQDRFDELAATIAGWCRSVA